MCFTNHALDQFLEGILYSPQFKDKPSEELKLVRIGGRSQSERLNKFNLKCVRSNTYLPRNVLKEKYEAQFAVDKDLRGLDKFVHKYLQSIQNYVTISELKKYDCISPEHYYYLFDNLKTELQRCYVLETWLQIFTIGNREEELQIVNEPSRVGNTRGFRLLQTDGAPTALNSLQKQDCLHESSQEQNFQELEDDKPSSEDETSFYETTDEEVEFIDIVGDDILEQNKRMIDDDEYKVHKIRRHEGNQDRTNAVK